MNTYRFIEIYQGLIESFSAPVTSQMVDTFIDLCGDRNLMHTDPSFAANYGFPDRLVHGMLTASLYSRLVGMYLPGKFALLQELAVSFIAPVFPGDTLTVKGEVTGTQELYSRIQIRGSITNQYGQKVSRAKIWTRIND